MQQPQVIMHVDRSSLIDAAIQESVELHRQRTRPMLADAPGLGQPESEELCKEAKQFLIHALNFLCVSKRPQNKSLLARGNIRLLDCSVSHEPSADSAFATPTRPPSDITMSRPC